MLSSLSSSSMQQNIHVIPRSPPQVGRSGSEQQRPVAFGRRAASIRYPSETPRLHLPVPFGRRDPSLYPIGEHNRPLQNSFGNFRSRVPRPVRCPLSLYLKQSPCGLSSPIQRIPVEILGEIFTRFLQEPQAGPYFDPFSSSLRSMKYSNTSPIILGHICHDWRMISLSMPTLWSSLAVHIPKQSYVPLIQLWLDRAANCPLALTLSQSTNPVVAELEAMNQILILFLTHAHLWRHIEFEFSRAPAETTLLNLPKTPSLESVHVNMPVGNWSPDSIDKFWRHIHSLPTLRKVSWDYVSRSRGLPVHAPWKQLTCINMPLMGGSAGLHQVLGTLQQCQELVELKCGIIMPLEPPISTLPVTLPKLRRLEIIFHGELDPSSFMKNLTLPSLASFDINQFFRPSASRRIRWLSDLLVRSACQLDKLSLTDPDLDEDEFLDFLSSPKAQHVVELQIRGRTFTDRAADFFTLKKYGKEPFLPNLRVLDLPRCDTFEGSIFEMISSRLPVLKFVRILGSSSVLALDVLALENLIWKGGDLLVIVNLQVDTHSVERRLGQFRFS